jgi:hypothetical protein
VVSALLRGYNYLYKVSVYQIKFDWSQASCPIGTTVVVVVTIATAVVAVYNVKRRSDKQQSVYFYVPNV